MESTKPGALDRRGLLLAFSAYLIWGAFPFYFTLLSAAGPFEIIGHRIVWTFIFCGVAMLIWGEWRHYREVLADRRLFLGLTAAGLLVTVNWSIYVWGVLNNHVVDAALGYFINPLVTVGLAVVVLKEQLRTTQKIAVGVGAAAVIVLAVGYGQIPWVALSLAVSFGTYGLLKKKVGGRVSPLVGLTVETTVLAPLALTWLVWLQASGGSNLTSHGPWLTVGLVASGLITAVPLLLFAAAASRIPLTMIGLIQYVTPTLQFAFGVWLYHEAMPPFRWAGFALVWVALAILTVDSVRASRGSLPVGEPEVMN